MSKLSKLLNPAPSTAQSSLPESTQNSPVQPLILEGHNHRTSRPSSSFSSHNPPSKSPTAPISSTSPGLETLAAAASNTAPILSLPQNISNLAQSGTYQGFPQFGSRPSSSHSLPPLPNDYPHASGNQIGPTSSGLDQYHHPSGDQGRGSDVTDHSARRPSLGRSPPEHSDPFSIKAPGAQPMDDTVNHFTEHATSSELRQPSLKEDLQAAANASATSQIRQHTLDHSQWLSAADVPNAQSEQIEIKAEMTDNPIVTPYQYDGQGGEGSETASGLAGTITSIPCSKTVSGIKKDASHTPSPIPTGEAAGLPAMKSKSAPSKKRAAPKKGTASTIKPPTKKRKLESDSVDGTPSAKRTGTPATSRASETPVPKNRKQGSITPARSSSVINGDGDGGGDEDVSDENDIFCVCRKPDDHTLMIGCDGPCEDWFHARCVNMDAVRTKLIFKWYCPNCSDKGHENLWKRMCRLEGCSEPARDGSVEPRSKYCSDEHGAEFMRQRVFGPGSETLDTGPPSNKKRRKANYTDNLGNTEEGLSDSDDRAHLRGGVLKASELKAVTDGVKDLQSFHKLGDGILSPPPTVSPEGDVKMEDGGEFYPDKISYTPEEMAQLESITAKKEQTRAKKRLLDDRDRLLVLIAARAKTVLAELKENDKSVKDICGYDNRLTWSDEEFNHWRVTPEGQEALAQVKEGDLDTGDQTMSGTSAKVNGSSDKEDDEMGKGVCKRKRCARHQAWLKLQKQDNLFERDQARQEMRKLDAEERGVRDRAKIRSLEAGDANAKG